MTSRVRLKTSAGDIVLALNEAKAPKTVANFLAYANDGFFDGTIFHRVIADFMIQGGGFTTDFQQKTTLDQIENEADNGLQNTRGSVAMARTMDPHSATAQFFINVKDNSFLNHSGKNSQGWGYCVFAEVVEGLDVVDTIKGAATGNYMGHQDVPKDAIVIESATVE